MDETASNLQLRPGNFGVDAEKPVAQPAPSPVLPPDDNDVLIGPARPSQLHQSLKSELDRPTSHEDTMLQATSWPFSDERTAVRQLTMPRVPDFDIPRSPHAGESVTTAETLVELNRKFATFLGLKEKKNTHFHARLVQSDAIKSPALMDKLMAFAGLLPNGPLEANSDEESGSSKVKRANLNSADTAMASAQYMTTLPSKLWDASAYPSEAYRRSLRILQEKAAKQRARTPGNYVEFVPAAEGVGAIFDGVPTKDCSRLETPVAGPETGNSRSRVAEGA